MSRLCQRLLEDIDRVDLEPYFKERICMHPVSKDLRGRFDLSQRDLQECRRPSCKTLKTVHGIKLDVRSHDRCDVRASRWLDGTISGKLVPSYTNDGLGRGYLVGLLEWSAQGAMLRGRISGVINAGTHRDPLMHCEKCDASGHVEGCLEAVVVDGDHKGCCVRASYMFKFNPGPGAEIADVEGTLEGLLICACAR